MMHHSKYTFKNLKMQIKLHHLKMQIKMQIKLRDYEIRRLKLIQYAQGDGI
jgi:hypothetical protein